MKLKLLRTLAGLSLLLPSILSLADDKDLELVEYMMKLQYFSHKVGLSINANNKPLAYFYLHELEEVINMLKDVEEYDGYPISKLTTDKLEPIFEKLEKSVEQRQFNLAQEYYDSMLNACNHCHTATGHNFIKIKKRSDNPFMQSFLP